MSADANTQATPPPTFDAAAVPRKSEGLVTRSIADETVVVPVRGRLAQLQNLYVLSEVGRHLWDEIDGERSIETLRQSVLSAYEVTEEQADRDLVEFFGTMVEAGLVHFGSDPGGKFPAVIEVHSLDVAGLQFVVKPPEGWRVVEDDPRYTGFLNTPSPEKTDVIDVDLTFDAPSFDGLPLLFDTGDAWRAFRDGDDILIDMAPPEVPGRLWTARLKADRRHISIYCGEPLVAGTAGDRQIRNPVRYPLDQILMLGILPSLGRLVVHGAGASRGGVGLGFPGYSGAGKSTLMSLMKRIPDVFGLSDDRIVLEGAPGPLHHLRDAMGGR
jgi:hypothetical protein